MSGDLPSMSYMALYIVSMHIINTNSRTSTHWKLNAESGKVQSALVAGGGGTEGDILRDLGGGEPGGLFLEDPLMSLLTSRVTLENGEWKLEAEPDTDANDNSDGHHCMEKCQDRVAAEGVHRLDLNSPPNSYTSPSRSHKDAANESAKNNNEARDKTVKRERQNTTNSSQLSNSSPGRKQESRKKSPILDCGRPVNHTDFDHLRGIANRKSHPHVPEPEVAMIFKKKGSRSSEVDMTELEKRLRAAKKEKPKSGQVYNQIGNFWRIKGNTQQSIECFRKALHYSPNNPDVLLNLARVLFNLQFLDDAIDLTQESLRMQSPDQNSWLQHFTLGEILKALGRYSEATIHFRHTLDLHPGFQPAKAHLREIEVNPDGTVTYYTLFIILFLVLGVLCGILTSIDGNLEELGETMKTQRHFNRAMAMRSIKLGINPKVIRMRKQGYNC